MRARVPALALLGVGLSLAIGCNRGDDGGGADSRDWDDPAVAAAEIDRWVAEEISSGTAEEARDWLQTEGNVLFEGDPDAVQELIDGLYADGAQHVWFTGIESIAGARVSATLAVALPEDMGSRQAILRREAAFWGEPDAAPDVGQRYLQFGLD